MTRVKSETPPGVEPAVGPISRLSITRSMPRRRPGDPDLHVLGAIQMRDKSDFGAFGSKWVHSLAQIRLLAPQGVPGYSLRAQPKTKLSDFSPLCFFRVANLEEVMPWTEITRPDYDRHLACLDRPASADGRAHLDGRQGAVPRQHLRRAALAHAQIRVRLSARLGKRLTGQGRYPQMDDVLQ